MIRRVRSTDHTRRLGQVRALFRVPRVPLMAALAIVALSGCFKLARPTPPLEEYVLGATVRSASAGAVADSAGLSIGLRRLDLAPYLSTPAIVIRQGSRIVTSGFRRWAEEPGAGVMRGVAASLRGAPTVRAVDVAPWSVRTPHDYLVQLHISRLEGVAEDSSARNGDVHVLASWEIIRGHDGILVARGETDRRERGWLVNDYSDLVTKLDKGLAGLANDLAACLVRVGPAMPVDTAAVGRVVACAARD
jgi:uncharacterized lipoprotein YmbA